MFPFKRLKPPTQKGNMGEIFANNLMVRTLGARGNFSNIPSVSDRAGFAFVPVVMASPMPHMRGVVFKVVFCQG